MSSPDLIAFLRERLDEDEKMARHTLQRHPLPSAEPWALAGDDEYDLLIIEPQRALDEVEVKRLILHAHLNAPTRFAGLGLAVRALAAPYCTHPDFREEWIKP